MIARGAPFRALEPSLWCAHTLRRSVCTRPCVHQPREPLFCAARARAPPACAAKTVPWRLACAAADGAPALPSPALCRTLQVYVYSPARTASQQGRALVGNWKIEFESTKKWDNPLMGWASSGDTLSGTGQTALNFTSKEAALRFAAKHGWQAEVTEPKQMVTGRKPKAYADRFSVMRKGLPIDPRSK